MSEQNTPMEIDIDDILKEAQEFVKLRSTFKTASNGPVGTPFFVISKRWIDAYKKYIFYKEVISNHTPSPQENHWQTAHPGPITNSDFLYDGPEVLRGSGSQEFEADVVDRYLRAKTLVNTDFEVVNPEIWEFLSKRYGTDFTVKRFYTKQFSYSYYTQAELRLPLVPVYIVKADELKNGIEFDKANIRYLQCPARIGFREVKKRLVDVLVHNKIATKATLETVRLWKATNYGKLNDSFKEIKISDDNVDENEKGVEFPGDSMEVMVGSSIKIEDQEFADQDLMVVEVGTPEFVYHYSKQEAVQVGSCEWCNNRRVLTITCQCKRVRYCNDECFERDKRFHQPMCSVQFDGQLNDIDQKKEENANDGLVGLTNLGNTCYMNSSIQCLSNTFELTKFFLDGRFKFVQHKTEKNPLGTEGRLVMAWAKLMYEMWNQNSRVVRPDLFKRILGEYAAQFQGYGQHDSHECINTVLDLLGEDLYRKGKKPYVEVGEHEGRSDEETAKEAWHKHLLRNESIITDLFHGQFKSTVCCSNCPRVSVTFDPSMTILLPIPSKKTKKSFFFIPYKIGAKYDNLSGDFSMRENESIESMREGLQQKYGLNSNDYVIAEVSDNEFIQFVNGNKQFDTLIGFKGITLLYQVDPDLPRAKKEFTPGRTDNNNGFDDSITKLVVECQLATQPGKTSYGYYVPKRDSFLPRLMWVNKSWNLQELHFSVFKFLRQVFAEWADWTDPDCTREPRTGKADLRKELVQFPYRPENWPKDRKFTKADFLALSDEEAFQMVFPTIATQEQPREDFMKYEISQQPYQLCFKNTSGQYEGCALCSKVRCTGCQVPFNKEVTISKVLEQLKIESNDTFFSDKAKLRGSECQVIVVWHHSLIKSFFEFMSTATTFTTVPSYTAVDETDSDKVALEDCLKEFKQSEVLDDDNMWYCNKCKDHVKATKTLELFRVPRVMIITLKRFKTTKSKYGFSGGQKLDTIVNFPLEGLNMSPYVLSQQQKGTQPLIYDCFAVSNHFGSVSFGHYTAFCQNPITKKWYDFDDSSVTEMSGGRKSVVTGAAYSLFYRLRGHCEFPAVSFEDLQQRPDVNYLEQLSQKEAK